VAVFFARWTGWGVLAYPILMLACCGGPFGAYAAFQDQASPNDDGIERSGVPLGGLAVGLVLGGLVIYLLGLALNVRGARHTVFEVPVQDLGRGTAVAGVLLLPLAAVGFVAAGVVWGLLIGWVVAVIAALVALSRRRKRMVRR
jgi:hypothetical protein